MRFLQVHNLLFFILAIPGFIFTGVKSARAVPSTDGATFIASQFRDAAVVLVFSGSTGTELSPRYAQIISARSNSAAVTVVACSKTNSDFDVNSPLLPSLPRAISARNAINEYEFQGLELKTGLSIKCDPFKERT